MNKLQVIAKNHQTYFIQRLINEVGKVSLIDPWRIKDQQRGLIPDLPVLIRTTGVYRDDSDLGWESLRAHPSSVVNPIESVQLCRSKHDQYVFFQKIGLPHLPWLNLQEASLSVLDEFLVQDTSQFLMKPHRGQGGWGIRVFSPSEFIEFFHFQQHSGGDLEYLLQPFVSKAREYRLFFIGEDFELTLERWSAAGAWASNFAQDGMARVVKTPAEFRPILELFRAHYPLGYGAMDFLVTAHKVVVLEMNAVPGIEQLEMVSGLNVIKEMGQRLWPG